jgi:tetratricopeptide (TPR) repeat protein
MTIPTKWFGSALLGISAVLSALPAHAGPEQWVEIRSPNFSVVTDAGEKRGREVALHFEQMRAVFGALMTRANVNIPVPLQIVAFHNTKELRDFAPLWKGKPTQVAGLFQGGEDRSFIMLDMSAENPWSVVFHEYAHQLMNGILSAHLDPWFEEGFAEYFSSIEVDSKQAMVGKPTEYQYQMLEHGGMMKVADLLKVRQNTQTYNENGEHRGVFYAESAMVVHYLYDNLLIPKLSVYFDLTMNKNVPVEQAFEQTFGMSTTKFDKVLRDYVSSGRYRYYPISTSKILSSDYTATAISATDAEAVMADIHLHSKDHRDKAVAEFQEILKVDPNNTSACRGLGYAYLQAKDFKQAGEYFRRAAQGDSKDPRVHYYSALLMSREGDFADQSRLPEMKKELETAIALDPNFADSYMLLGLTEMYGKNSSKALEAMQKAVQLSPRNEQYQYNLAHLYVDNRQFDLAIQLLQGLQKAQNQQLALSAGEMVARIQQMKQAMLTGALPPSSQAEVVRVAPDHPTDPQAAGEAAAASAATVSTDAARIRFLKGTVTGVDCSSPPAAVMTVVSNAKTWKMKVGDSSHVVLIGADKFSCGWSQQKVALNYHETGTGEGIVVSVEIQ